MSLMMPIGLPWTCKPFYTREYYPTRDPTTGRAMQHVLAHSSKLATYPLLEDGLCMTKRLSWPLTSKIAMEGTASSVSDSFHLSRLRLKRLSEMVVFYMHVPTTKPLIGTWTLKLTITVEIEILPRSVLDILRAAV